MISSWYDVAMEKEAGMRENISALFFAFSLISGGASAAEAAAKANVPVQTIVQKIDFNAMKSMTNEQKKQYLDSIKGKISEQVVPSTIEPQPIDTSNGTDTSKIDKITIEDFVSLILKHENLLPRQTPFRITNEDMKNWDTIYGFEIDKTMDQERDDLRKQIEILKTRNDKSSKKILLKLEARLRKYENAKNFIFLKNDSDVRPAVRKLFERYYQNSGKFKLPNNPTVRQSIKKFDQSGSEGKVSFMQGQLGLEDNEMNELLKRPISSLFK